MSSIDSMIPKLMKLVRFHGKLKYSNIRVYTGYGNASIRDAVNSMIKSGLVKREGEFISLTKDSKYWLGWNKF